MIGLAITDLGAGCAGKYSTTPFVRCQGDKEGGSAVGKRQGCSSSPAICWELLAVRTPLPSELQGAEGRGWGCAPAAFRRCRSNEGGGVCYQAAAVSGF